MIRKHASLLLFSALLAVVTSVVAGELKTVTLDVEEMTCNMCPITVKKALRKVDGVTEVQAKYEGDGQGWARVTFDSAKTTVEALMAATAQAGYPSHVKE